MISFKLTGYILVGFFLKHFGKCSLSFKMIKRLVTIFIICYHIKKVSFENSIFDSCFIFDLPYRLYDVHPNLYPTQKMEMPCHNNAWLKSNKKVNVWGYSYQSNISNALYFTSAHVVTIVSIALRYFVGSFPIHVSKTLFNHSYKRQSYIILLLVYVKKN